MNTFKIIIIIILLGCSFSGCEEKILDKEPLTIFSENDVWTDMSLASKFATNIYNCLEDYGVGSVPGGHYWRGGRAFPGCVTDEVYDHHGDQFVNVWNIGALSPADMAFKQSCWSSIWEAKYSYIRKCNIFLANIDNVEATETEKSELKGEVKYLRARYYYDLVTYWGGVPLITEVFELDDEFEMSRTPYEDLVDWIVSELDEAREMLPEQRTADEFGKVNRGACLALKSNLLLHANSKLHDPSTEPSGPLFDYTKDTWDECAKAAKAVIDMPQFSLEEVDDFMDYHGIFMYPPKAEIIFAKPYHPNYRGRGHNITTTSSPPYWGGWGMNNPRHDFVQDFEMANGMKIDEPGSGYNPSIDSMYENRELRFYANILYNGATYRGRELEYHLPGGLESTDNNTANASRTGYNLRKFVDEEENFGVTLGNDPWVYLRLAEMYLNYAEAQYNMGNENLAREYVNIIRNRVKLPDINSSGEALFEDIQHERKIELCFEHHRFYDVRRWMIADVTCNEDVRGLRWKKVDSNGDLDPDGELTVEEYTAAEHTFFDKMYYLPIPQSEVEKSGLTQNPGYN